ncbi:hypothetical protein GF407_01130 [candidate division KSB1 bacterium]|nr:hypothetical protein [candidate division KSB1 bacterium]
MKTRLLIFCSGLLLFTACSETSEEEPLLQPPMVVAAVSDMAEQERGIDAVPESNAIQIQWMKQNIYDGYQLYRKSQSQDEFDLFAEISGEDSTYLDIEVEQFKRYFYYIIGFSDRQSAPSDTVNYMLVTKAYNLSVSLQDSIIFHWQLEDIAPDEYILKLFDDTSNEKIWFSRIQSSYQGMSESVIYNWDGMAASRDLEADVRYRWRVDIVGPAHRSGSESRWHRFELPQ